MSAPHPINQAVVAQALHDLRNGQLRRCKAMGFDDKDLEALKRPAMVSLLINASVSWCTIKVNREVLQRLLHQVNNVEQEIEKVDRMLKLGASTDMVHQLYGLTHEEVALRRTLLHLPKRKGRHPVLSEQEDVRLWELWTDAIRQQGINLSDDIAVLDTTLDIAEEMKLPASVLWSTIHRWIDEGLAERTT
jgi:hypothetical protein